MDGETFLEGLHDAKRTELDRLGSDTLLLAHTEANLTESTVLEVAANSEYAARETFRTWARDESYDDVRAHFESVAAQEDEHYNLVVAELDEHDPPGVAGPMHAYLRERDDTVERIATGMVARPLVSVRAHTQVINFFVNEAEQERADLFRSLKDDTAEVLDEGLALLEDHCADDEAWERARMTGEYLIQIAYDDFADSLQEMGLDPKPLC